MKAQPLVLIIMDGWGFGKEDPKVNAIHKAQTPFYDSLLENKSCTSVFTSGSNVGLPEGQMGNSEVGHLNIGAGRVVHQPLVLIDRAFKNGTVKNNDQLRGAFSYALQHNKKVHFMGLVSDGGIHSSIDHLYGLCDAAAEFGLSKVYVHAFTDGRDTNTHEGAGYIKQLSDHLNKTTGKIASVTGRYYAMDRDKRWERTEKAYKLLTKGEGHPFQDPEEAVRQAYADNITDEFIEPSVITDRNGAPLATIHDGDVVICFNFRTDRARQITEVLTQYDIPEQNMKKLRLHYLTMTEYDKTYKDIKTLFQIKPQEMTLGEKISGQGLKQLRIAETEKYPHVTYFFSGGIEEPFKGEKRFMAQSPKVPTYDLKPEMSAAEINEYLIPALKNNKHDLVILNYANPDMVGHTGVFEAVVKAVETVDHCCREVVEAASEHGYTCIVTSDHGNAEYMLNQDGTPNTAHTVNPVPLFVIDPSGKNIELKKEGRLADIAPTILELMGLDKPGTMTGESLLK